MAQLKQRIPVDAEARGLTTVLHALKGETPWLAVWQCAGRVSSDLICMATHSRDAPWSLVLGSQAQELLQRSQHPRAAGSTRPRRLSARPITPRGAATGPCERAPPGRVQAPSSDRSSVPSTVRGAPGVPCGAWQRRPGGLAGMSVSLGGSEPPAPPSAVIDVSGDESPSADGPQPPSAPRATATATRVGGTVPSAASTLRSPRRGPEVSGHQAERETDQALCSSA